MDSQQEVANLFKVLTHPTRIAILELLRGGEQCVCHLEAALGARQAYISQQLAVLREAGLVADERDGLNVYYRIVRPEIFAVIGAARALLNLAPPILQPDSACPCPRCATSATSTPVTLHLQPTEEPAS
jgi:ArsR family transcriptional regulator